MDENTKEKFNESVEKTPQRTDHRGRTVLHEHEEGWFYDHDEEDDEWGPPPNNKYLNFIHWEVFNHYLQKWYLMDQGFQEIFYDYDDEPHCIMFGVHRESMKKLLGNFSQLKEILTTEDEFIGFENLVGIMMNMEPKNLWSTTLKKSIFHPDYHGCEFSMEGIKRIKFDDFNRHTIGQIKDHIRNKWVDFIPYPSLTLHTDSDPPYSVNEVLRKRMETDIFIKKLKEKKEVITRT